MFNTFFQSSQLLYNTDPIPATKPTPKVIGSEMPTNPPAKNFAVVVPTAINNGKLLVSIYFFL